MQTKKGTIAGISGHPMSGLWMLHFDDGSICHIASGHGVRQLSHCFGATEWTNDLLEKIIGQEIVYSVDALCVLDGFTPIDDWDGPEIPDEGIFENEQNEEN